MRNFALLQELYQRFYGRNIWQDAELVTYPHYLNSKKSSTYTFIHVAIALGLFK